MRAVSPLRLGIRAPGTSPIPAGSERSRTRNSWPCYAKAKAPCLLSVKRSPAAALSETEAAAIRQGLSGLGERPEGAAILTGLEMDRFASVTNASVLTDFQSPSQSERALEVAMPALYPVGTSGLPPLDPGAVPFLVGVELVEVAIPSELVDAVLERKDP